MLFEILLALQTASAKPIDPGTWIAASDYPTEALASQAQGTVRVTLEVDADGRPTACAIAKSSEFPILDSTTCDLLMQRARFKPARDDKGNAVAGDHSQNVRWEIPAPTPVEFVSGMLVATFRLSPDNVVVDCKGEVFGGLPDWMEKRLCEGVASQMGGPRTEGLETIRFALSHSLSDTPYLIEPGPDWGTLIARQTTRFEINSQGEVDNCRVTAAIGDLPPGGSCAMLSRDTYVVEPDRSREGVYDIAVFGVRAATDRGTP